MVDIIAHFQEAAFNRVPDAGGLSNWMNQYMAGLMTYAQIAENFTTQPEYTAKYPSIMTNTEYVTEIYNNVFGRTPDAGGLVNWVNQLDATSITGINRGNIMTYMLASAGAAGNTDGERLDNQAAFAVQSILDGVPEATATAQLANITSDDATVTAATAAVSGEAGAVLGESFSLTTGVDTKLGTANNDTFTAVIDGTTGAVATTMTALDTMDGAAGNDTFNLNVLNGSGGAGTAVAALPSITVSNIETMNIRSAVALGTVGVNDLVNDATDNANATPSVSIDVSAYTGLTALNVTQATSASIEAATTTNVTVSGATGALEVVSAKNVSITDATADKNITVGSYVAAAADDTNTAGDVAGTITVTDTKQGTGVILVDGGTNVTVTATSDKTSGAIVVGSVDEASGTVSVTQNTNVTSDAATAADIAVTGGTTITVNKNSTNVASKGDVAANVTAGAITVTGGNTTTTVNVAQTHSATDFANDASAGSAETSLVTFGSLKSGEKVAISGGALTALGTDLTFTAAKDLTAAEVAAAFASLTADDIQASGGKVANGIFTGALDAGWTSGAVSGSSVTFTSTTKANIADVSEIVITAKKADGTTNVDNVASFTEVETDGAAAGASTAVDVTAATAGNVTINDNATASITDVTVNGYATLAIGTTTALTKLANLSLANSAGAATVDAAAGITSLNLTVNKVNNAVDISTNSTTVATLNATATGANSSFALTAAQLTDLNVSGDKTLTLTGSTLTVLEDVVVTGTAGLTIGGTNEVDTVKSVTTTGTTGAVTIAIDGTVATYTGGAGVDTVTLATGTALTKAINLGAGDDTLVFSAAVTGSSTTLSGGEGTDTLSMTEASAAGLDGTAQTFYTSFERLKINSANTAASTINLANLGFTSYVTTSGTGSVVYTDTVAYIATNKVSVVINGTTVTAALPVAPDSANITTALNAAANTALGTAGVTYVAATLTNTDLTLTVTSADAALYTITAGTMTNAADVSLASTATEGALTLDKLAANSTVVLTKDGAITAVLTDATGGADIINVTANVAASSIDFGTFTAAGLETINLTANDTNIDEDVDGTTYEAGDRDTTTLSLVADTATTLNITGNASVTLGTLTNAAKLAMIDGSAMTGSLSLTSANTTTAVTIKGGSAADTITAASTTTFVNTIYGYDGNDSITAGAGLDKLYGGNGADTFNVAVASTNVNSGATIMDIASGDVVKFAGTVGAFKSAAVTLDPDGNPSLTDYANAAINAIAANEMGWFQYNNNTYIVKDITESATFTEGTDMIVKIAGTVDLSTASYNATTGTLEIA